MTKLQFLLIFFIIILYLESIQRICNTNEVYVSYNTSTSPIITAKKSDSKTCTAKVVDRNDSRTDLQSRQKQTKQTMWNSTPFWLYAVPIQPQIDMKMQIFAFRQYPIKRVVSTKYSVNWYLDRGGDQEAEWENDNNGYN